MCWTNRSLVLHHSCAFVSLRNALWSPARRWLARGKPTPIKLGSSPDSPSVLHPNDGLWISRGVYNQSKYQRRGHEQIGPAAAMLLLMNCLQLGNRGQWIKSLDHRADWGQHWWSILINTRKRKPKKNCLCITGCQPGFFSLLMDLAFNFPECPAVTSSHHPAKNKNTERSIPRIETS